jgi:hypothetical protein
MITNKTKSLHYTTMAFVAKYSPQGDKVIIIVPKQHHEAIKKLTNPLHVTVEEILE